MLLCMLLISILRDGLLFSPEKMGVWLAVPLNLAVLSVLILALIALSSFQASEETSIYPSQVVNWIEKHLYDAPDYPPKNEADEVETEAEVGVEHSPLEHRHTTGR